MHGRSVRWATAATAGVLALVLMAAPSVAAQPNAHLKAPYSGTSAVPGSASQSQCGSNGAHAATWSAKTGTVNGQVDSKSTKCPAPLSNDVASYSEIYEQIAFPVAIGTTGLYNASVTFHYKLTSSAVAKVSHCPGAINYSAGYDYVTCYAVAEVDLAVTLQIYNVSGMTWMAPGFTYWTVENYTAAYQDNDCSYGSCVSFGATDYCTGGPYQYEIQGEFEYYGCVPLGAASGSGKAWIDTSDYSSYDPTGPNVTLDPSDSYDVVATVTFDTTTYGEYDSSAYNAGSYSGAVYAFPETPSANLNALSSSGGNGVTITSVGAVLGY